ncbi:MAG: hypothetical protein VKP72_06875 [bacterium]|nr:hypothetical protein [bacterium]
MRLEPLPPEDWFDSERFTLVLSDGSRLGYSQNGWGQVLEVMHVEAGGVRWPVPREVAEAWFPLLRAAAYAGLWGVPIDHPVRIDLETRARAHVQASEAHSSSSGGSVGSTSWISPVEGATGGSPSP